MSSWFDPSGIASLAKNALKEAQKTIDKALDIQEDDEDDDGLRPAGVKPTTESSSTTTTTTSPLPTMAAATTTTITQMRQSRSHPALPTAAASQNTSAAASAAAANADPTGISIWGSFTGTFFDAATQQQDGGTTAVTTPPSSANTTGQPATNRPRSSAKSIDSSVSGSVELVTPPTTPGSSLVSPTSPDTHPAATSSSVGVLADSCVSSSASPSEIPRTVSSTPSEEVGGGVMDASSLSFDDDAHVYIAEPHYLADDQSLEEEDEEDSRSFNTVAEAQAIGALPDGGGISRAGSLHLDLVAAAPSSSDAASAHLTDSTQSFEYVSHTAALSTSVAQQQPQIDVTKTTTTSTSAAAAPTTRTISPANSSTTSTDGRSDDIVKISSSGHTSGDDGAETATSSDIEIISSPTTGGDSSSTNSACKVSPSMCQSAAAAAAAAAAQHHHQHHHSTTTTAGTGGGLLLMTTTAAAAAAIDSTTLKGHTRVSSTASDDSALRFGAGIAPGAADELQRLRRHLAEQSEVLEARELKLVDVAREAAELHEQCARLQLALDAKRRRDDCLQVATVTEEFTQRLAALEKKFQLCIRERDALREQLLGARTELAGRVAADVVERQLRDKDFVIGELQGEGEKLAKQVLQHSNIIKKLRVKERDSDSQHKAEREQIAEQAGELERLKRTLGAKEEVERTQIEAVHRLSGANRKLERETVQLRSALEDAEQRVQTLQTSVEAARKEVHVRQAASAQLTRTSEQLGVLEAERVQSDAKREQLHAEVVQLRVRVRDAEAGTSAREVSLRAENRQLLQRLEELEQRLEEQTAAITTATIPLVRQAEALQQTLNGRTAVWERQERELMGQLERAQAAVAQMRQAERRAGEVDEQQAKQVKRLEEQLATALLRAEQATSTLQQHIVEAELSKTDERRKRAEREALVERLTAELAECRAELDAVRQEAQELRQQHKEQQQQQQRTEQEQSRRQVSEEAKAGSNDGDEADRRRSRDNSSPTLSLGRLSLADSLSSHLWQVDDMDCISSAGRSGHLHQLHHQPHNASLLEGLQSTLKQRDGENHQLQWELSRQQADRNCMMAEISTLTEQVDDLKERVQANEGAAALLSDVQRKYDALLQMYGEKVEEVQELHLDLDDVKEMYRGQIDELLRQQRAAAAVASSVGRPAVPEAAGEGPAT